jgi:DNA-binding protein HU-beta
VDPRHGAPRVVKMNKSELVSHLSSELHTSKLSATRLLDSVLSAIQKGLLEEGSVTLTGFGTFEVKNRKSRVGRNPMTGEPIQIGAGKRVGFRVGKTLKQMV